MKIKTVLTILTFLVAPAAIADYHCRADDPERIDEDRKGFVYSGYGDNEAEAREVMYQDCLATTNTWLESEWCKPLREDGYFGVGTCIKTD